MKTIVVSFVLSIALALTAHAQSGGAFDLNWFTFDGGGPSSGGSFSLNGTSGQPEAGTMSGGNYSLTGGFWGAMQTPAPARSVILKVWVVGHRVHLRFTGIPGRIYYVERAQAVAGPWPDRLAAITMPVGGVVDFVDTTDPVFTSPQFFYRTSTD